MTFFKEPGGTRNADHAALLAELYRKEPVKTYLIKRDTNAGWLIAKAGDYAELTDDQAKALGDRAELVKSKPSRTETPDEPAVNDDPPGAPPIVTTQISSQTPSGGTSRKSFKGKGK